MQSNNYVPGVSGWKLHKNGGFDFYSPGDPCLSSLGAKEAPKPFVVVDGVVYISAAEIERASVAAPKLAEDWSVNVQLLNGRHVAAGIGLGLDSQPLVSADRFAINDRDAGKILEELASHISKTELGSALAEQIKPIAETVREVLREELQPGGILHRK